MTPRKATKPRQRRARGSGSITEHKGRYLARLRLKANADGERESTSKLFDRREDAEQWVRDEKARLALGAKLKAERDRQPLGEFLEEFYRDIRKTSSGRNRTHRHLSANTCSNDWDVCRFYIAKRSPSLWRTPLRDLTAHQLERFFDELPKSATIGGVTYKALSLNTVSRVYRILRARLGFAVKTNRLRYNPMLSDLICVSGTRPREHKTLNFPQAQALLRECEGTQYGYYFALLLLTGMRPSELAGCLWSDVSFESRTISVRRSLERRKPTDAERGTGDSWSLKETKTRKSRLLPLPAEAVAILERHKAAQAELRKAAGPEWVGREPLVCTTDYGQPLHLPAMASRYFDRLQRAAALKLAGVEPLPLPPVSRAKAYTDAVAARRAQEEQVMQETGFPRITLYELRHTHSTLLLRSNVALKVVSERLGHSKISTTADIYSHVSPDMQRAAVSALEEGLALGRPAG